MDTTGLWTVVQLIWQPVGVHEEPIKVPASEIENILDALMKRLADLYSSNRPAYLIFHVGNVFPLKSRFSSEKALKELDSRKAGFVEYIQGLCDLGQGHISNGWLPNRFRLYDYESRQRGWLAISPTRALLVDVSEEQVIILENLLQPGDTGSNTDPGIRSDRYREFLGLVMQWVSNQDGFQAVNQLKDLVKSGTQAIDGQVWLNFAVATIGIVIAFLLIPGQMYQVQLEWTLVCLCVASLGFWAYARWGRKIFLIAGWILLVVIVYVLWPLILIGATWILQHL